MGVTGKGRWKKPTRKHLDVVTDDMTKIGVEEEDVEDIIRQRVPTHCGEP